MRTVREPVAPGDEYDISCFGVPQMDTTLADVDFKKYGFVDNDSDYLFHYFMDEIQEARYVRIVGYGNSHKDYYMWSSFTEVQVFGPDKTIVE